MAFPRRTWMYEFVMKTASYENSKTTFQSQLGELHTKTYSQFCVGCRKPFEIGEKLLGDGVDVGGGCGFWKPMNFKYL